MSEAILKALMQLFALIVDIDEVQQVSDKEREIIRSFLMRQLNSELSERYMLIFENYLHHYHDELIDKESVRRKKRTSLTAVRILSICEQINEELEARQKIYVIILLVEYIAYGIEIHETELDFLQTVATAFNLDEDEYLDILNFIIYSLKDIPRKEAVLVINSEEKGSIDGVHHIRRSHLEGDLSFLSITSVNTYVMRYHGKEDLFLNGQHIQPGFTYTFDHGASIRGSHINPIYYTDVAGFFTTYASRSKIKFIARDVEFRFRNSDNGIQSFNLDEESGRLIGIMGGSGVGKSTLLNVLNGNLKPQSGQILINGFDLYQVKDQEQLKGIIGFVPQDDMLLEDLTVWQNLWYNARLCLASQSEEDIKQVVEEVLLDLDLWEIRDLKVGKPLNKVISGGQRKRVNIGLELLREPSILYVDEPTSGLSSVDSEMVMNLLREQVVKGRLVIVNIHQPSSNLYKMFDRIIFLDKGGYQIYYGNPSEAVVYFKSKSNHANASEDQCPTCGNIDPDQVLQIIEAKIVNEYGKLSRTRKVSPKEWAELFRASKAPVEKKAVLQEELPENDYSIPRRLEQMKIFFSRDIRSKLTNLQYILIALLEAPLLALIMAFFTKYFSGTADNPVAYVFRNNENLPAYLLMSVIVFLFLGMTISSEEIIKDRTILKRESFLNLSRGSYLNAKILVMFAISAFQALTYVLIGNLIFEIKDMFLPYWLILFSTACFANMLGLNISAGLNSVITIYILVPFLLIPQILFSGVLVKYDKLHKSLTNYEYVPVIGDMMTSRWAYEALAVEQFKNNPFEREYYAVDQQISQGDYYQAYLIPELELRIEHILNDTVEEMTEKNLQRKELIASQLQILQQEFPEIHFPLSMEKGRIPESDSTWIQIRAYLSAVSETSRHLVGRNRQAYSRIEKELINRLGGVKAYTDFRNSYENKQLADLLLNRNDLEKVVERDGRLIRKHQPAYMKPSSKVGRAHLYAPVKNLGPWEMDTRWFNLLIIWVFTLILYVALYQDWLRKVLNWFSEINRMFLVRLKKSN